MKNFKFNAFYFAGSQKDENSNLVHLFQAFSIISNDVYLTLQDHSINNRRNGLTKPINLSLESYTVQLISVDLQNCKYGPHPPKAMSTNAGKVVAKDAMMKREQTLGGLGK